MTPENVTEIRPGAAATPCHSTRHGISYRGGAGLDSWSDESGIVYLSMNDGDDLVTFDRSAALAWHHALTEQLFPPKAGG